MAIKFAVVLPVPPVMESDWAEVAKGVLTVAVAGGEPITIDTDKALQESDTRNVTDDLFVGPQGALVEMSFAYVDDAGNVGAAITAVQELLDTVPPVTPTAIGLVETEETPD